MDTEKKYRPLLMTSQLVRETLDGRKTQTRRLAPVPDYIHLDKNIFEWPLSVEPYFDEIGEKEWIYAIQTAADDRSYKKIKNRYGNPGDILWVRETWAPAILNNEPRVDGYIYKADQEPVDKFQKWRPGIHMPWNACRLLLEIQKIRIERLHDITEADAQAEGADRGILRDGPNTEKGEFHLEHNNHGSYKAGFQFLWQTIHGRESWDANPWVWVIEYLPIRLDQSEFHVD